MVYGIIFSHWTFLFGSQVYNHLGRSKEDCWLNEVIKNRKALPGISYVVFYRISFYVALAYPKAYASLQVLHSNS